MVAPLRCVDGALRYCSAHCDSRRPHLLTISLAYPSLPPPPGAGTFGQVFQCVRSVVPIRPDSISAYPSLIVKMVKLGAEDHLVEMGTVEIEPGSSAACPEVLRWSRLVPQELAAALLVQDCSSCVAVPRAEKVGPAKRAVPHSVPACGGGTL